MYVLEIIKLQFDKKCHILLCGAFVFLAFFLELLFLNYL